MPSEGPCQGAPGGAAHAGSFPGAEVGMLESFGRRSGRTSAAGKGCLPVPATAGPILVLSCFTIVLGAALTRRNQGTGTEADRWAVAAGLLVVLSIPWGVVAWLESPGALLDPLEHLVGAVTPAILGWAALGLSAKRRWDLGLSLVLGVSGLLFAASVLTYTGSEAFNLSPLDQAWAILTVIMGAGGAIVILFRRPRLWWLFDVSLVLLAAGAVVDIQAIPPGSGAPSIVLATFLAAPPAALAATILLTRWNGATVQPVTHRMEVPRASQLQPSLRLAQAETAATFAESLTEVVGTSTRAEYCLLLTSPEPDGSLSMGPGYDLVRQVGLPGGPVNAGKIPLLVDAMRQRQSLYLPAIPETPDVGAILKVLGPSGPSPALLVPLPAGEGVVAGLLLLSPHSQRIGHEEIRSVLEAHAPWMGERLQRLMNGATDGDPVADLLRQLEDAQRQLAELEAASAAAAESGPDWVGIEDAQSQLNEAFQTIETLQSELERLKASARPAPPVTPEPDRLRAELALALSALAEARQEVADAKPSSEAGRSSNGFTRSIDEVRQPLAAISGYTELLLGESVGFLGANQRKFLERIRGAVRRMELALTALAQRARSSPPPPLAESTDLGAAIERGLEGVQDDLRARGLAVRLDLPPEPVLVSSSTDTIATIVSDLLSNAVTATPSGREIHLSLLPDLQEHVAILAVTDRGRGVAAGDLHRVFNADPWGEPVRGLGLDGSRLSRVKALTESIGGRAWVEREPSGGTTFFVLFPSSR